MSIVSSDNHAVTSHDSSASKTKKCPHCSESGNFACTMFTSASIEMSSDTSLVRVGLGSRSGLNGSI